MILTNRIRSIRESYGLTQAEVAYRCNITPSAYGQIERNAEKTKFETLIKIADAIGVTISLFSGFSVAKYSSTFWNQIISE
jgi:transcriptional regulator with XRE-family HTH domain